MSQSNTADAIAIRCTVEVVIYVKPDTIENNFDMARPAGKMEGDEHLNKLRKIAEKHYATALEVALPYIGKDLTRELRVPVKPSLQKSNSSITLVPDVTFLNAKIGMPE